MTNRYEVNKTDILGVGPWYIWDSINNQVIGTFREETHARIACEAIAQSERKKQAWIMKGGEGWKTYK